MENRYGAKGVKNAILVMGIPYPGPILHRQFFCIIWSHTDFEILAVVAHAQYNHLCLRRNNSKDCSSRPIISGILVQNVYLCKALASDI